MKKKLMGSVITGSLMFGLGAFSPISAHADLLSRFADISSSSSVELQEGSVSEEVGRSSLAISSDTKVGHRSSVTLAQYIPFVHFLESIVSKLEETLAAGDVRNAAQISSLGNDCIMVTNHILDPLLRWENLYIVASIVATASICSESDLQTVRFIMHLFDSKIVQLKHFISRMKRTGKKEHARKYIKRVQQTLTQIYDECQTVMEFHERKNRRLARLGQQAVLTST